MCEKYINDPIPRTRACLSFNDNDKKTKLCPQFQNDIIMYVIVINNMEYTLTYSYCSSVTERCHPYLTVW